MSESVTIVLPLPSNAMRLNGPHGHWATVARARSRCRTISYLKTLEANIETGPWEKVEVQATFFHRQKRRRDGVEFNAMLKSHFDGIVDAGLVVDDSWDHWTTLPPRFEIDKENPRVEITVVRKDEE